MTDTTTPEAVTFYWRPGCGFCMRLERELDDMGIPLDRVNIWDDPHAAATVRSIANGNETVPTVVVGDAQLVNPRAHHVIDVLAAVAPQLVPDEIPEPRGLVSRLIGR